MTDQHNSRPHIALLSLPGNFHCRKWAKALSEAGARVTVFSFELAENSPHFEQVQLSPPVHFGGMYRYPSYPLTAKPLRQELARRDIDFVYAMGATPFGTWVRKSGFRPYAVAALGADVFDYLPENARERSWNQTQSGVLEGFRKTYFKRAVGKTLHEAAFITADNHALTQAMTQHFGAEADKIHLLRWGIDQAAVPNPPSAQGILMQLGLGNKPIVLSPRGLLPVYQPHFVIEAYAKLAPLHPDVQFVVLTAGYAAKPSAMRLVRELASTQPNVHLINRQLTQTESYALMQAASAMVSIPRYDGFSASVNEALYFETLPVVGRISATEELLNDGLQLLMTEPLTAETLANQISIALDMPIEKRAQLTAHNAAWVRQNALLRPSAEAFITLVNMQ